MRYSLIFWLLLLPFVSEAQFKKVDATIVDPGSLYSSYDFEEDPGKLKPAIRLTGTSADLAKIIKYSNEANWPIAMQQLDSRLANRSSIQLYKVYKILHTSDFCILIVPAAENKHMPENMRPAQDIYFIMNLNGAAFEGNTPAINYEEEDPYAYEDEYEYDDVESVFAKIIAPGELYSTFDLNNNSSIRSLIVESGILTEDQFQIIVKLANENSWPVGISTLNKRLEAATIMKSYNAQYLLNFGENNEYVLVWIPKEENYHMPISMQPTSDEGFYFVLKASAIEIE